MASEPLSAADIDERLADLPGWSVTNDRLRRDYTLDGHPSAAALVLHIATIQEDLDHHAEVTLGYRTVVVETTTHSVGGRVTDRDVTLARRIEEVAPSHGAQV